MGRSRPRPTAAQRSSRTQEAVDTCHSCQPSTSQSYFVDSSAATLGRVPRANLRVRRADFGAVWARAEQLGRLPSAGDDFLAGVILTCRWLAAQPVRSTIAGRAEIPAAPLTGRRDGVTPETVEVELLAAYSRYAVNRELAKGVAATLEWAWRGSGRLPLDAGRAATG